MCASNVERNIKEINSLKKRLETFASNSDSSSSIELQEEEPIRVKKSNLNVGKVFHKPVKTSTFHRQCFRTCKNCPSERALHKGGLERTRKTACLEEPPVRNCTQHANIKEILKKVHLTWVSDDSSYKEIKEPINKKEGVHRKTSEVLKEYFHSVAKDERAKQKREEATQVNLNEDKETKRETRRAQWKTLRMENTYSPEPTAQTDKCTAIRAPLAPQKTCPSVQLPFKEEPQPAPGGKSQTSPQETPSKTTKQVNVIPHERPRSSPIERTDTSVKTNEGVSDLPRRYLRSYERPTMSSLLRAKGVKEKSQRREEVRPFTAGAPSKTHNLRMKIQETLSMLKRIKPARIEPLFNDMELLFSGAEVDREESGAEGDEILCQKDFLAKTKLLYQRPLIERPKTGEEEGERPVQPTTNPARILHRLDLFQYHLKEM